MEEENALLKQEKEELNSRILCQSEGKEKITYSVVMPPLNEEFLTVLPSNLFFLHAFPTLKSVNFPTPLSWCFFVVVFVVGTILFMLSHWWMARQRLV